MSILKWAGFKWISCNFQNLRGFYQTEINQAMRVFPKSPALKSRNREIAINQVPGTWRMCELNCWRCAGHVPVRTPTCELLHINNPASRCSRSPDRATPGTVWRPARANGTVIKFLFLKNTAVKTAPTFTKSTFVDSIPVHEGGLCKCCREFIRRINAFEIHPNLYQRSKCAKLALWDKK